MVKVFNKGSDEGSILNCRNILRACGYGKGFNIFPSDFRAREFDSLFCVLRADHFPAARFAKCFFGPQGSILLSISSTCRYGGTLFLRRQNVFYFGDFFLRADGPLSSPRPDAKQRIDFACPYMQMPIGPVVLHANTALVSCVTYK